jgi:type I restriction enzyme M protein
MLDTLTKKRIDDCRDILVGKLPDPKAQIEQITIGLIYKFMDDMDKEAIELGSIAKFFSGDFEKYSWDSLFDTKVTATEMLGLYSESIISMDKNPNIPELFRNIFKNAYLPYRDPETLKLFLKTIGEFEYTHSEKLGDAFEYLLSVMGSQGDAGQFRTPRHIIDFLVACVDPGKTDTILDPACGTAGFLISAFKHIQAKNQIGLTPDERKKLIQNFVGYDISPDMVRLSLVNLYLHGFSDPHIWEYDTLSSEDRWNENFDVVLANPPFMSPKGGIRPHKKFTISSSRSEVLFVDYIAEHLNPRGRAGIIIPEGVLFQSGKAFKDLRKMLIEDYLYAVVSLPAGVFNPYSAVKTSILLMDKEQAKKTNEVLFVKIDNDGFSLGAQRNPIKGGQIEEALQAVVNFKESKLKGVDFESSQMYHAVAKSEIVSNEEYNLSGEKYITAKEYTGKYELVKLVDICDKLFAGGDAPQERSKTKTEEFTIPIYSNGVGEKSLYGFSNISRVEEDAVTISARGTIGYARVRKAPFLPIVRLIVAIPNKNKVDLYYLKLLLESLDIYRTGNSIPQLTVPMIRDEKIPLPPLSIQEEIVAEIKKYELEINELHQEVSKREEMIVERIAKVWGE